MNLRSSSLLPALFVAAATTLSLGSVACQEEDTPKKPAAQVGSGGAGNTTAKGGSGQGNNTSQGGSDNPDGGAGGKAGNGTSGTCEASEADLFRINNPNLGEEGIKINQKVRVTGIVATSRKFLASAGSCLWAFTATMPGEEVQEYGSIQVVAKGNPPLVGEDGKAGDCPRGEGEAGPIPNDLVPGDLIDVTAYAGAFLQTSCDKAPNVKPAGGQRQLDVNVMNTPAECFVRTPGGTVPAPHVFATKAEMSQLADGTDLAFLQKWGGALVTLQGPLKAVQPADKTKDYLKPEDAVSKFGDMALDGTTLTINNNVLFSDLSGTGPKDTNKRLAWALTTEFESITGLALIDFCTWSLSLREKCDDVKPASTTCP